MTRPSECPLHFACAHTYGPVAVREQRWLLWTRGETGDGVASKPPPHPEAAARARRPWRAAREGVQPLVKQAVAGCPPRRAGRSIPPAGGWRGGGGPHPAVPWSQMAAEVPSTHAGPPATGPVGPR
eukprot:610001-Heterocapsa_arctica.AAC.1